MRSKQEVLDERLAESTHLLIAARSALSRRCGRVMESMRGRKDARDEYKEEDVSTTISSEVARLRMRIARECEAMHRGLSGVAMVARHAFINEWYAALEASWQRLEELIGAEQASTLVCQTYFQMIEPNGGRADAAETATDDC